MLKVIIDTDVGIDDSFAILYALKCSDIDVIGITTNSGNTTSSQAAINSLQLLDLACAKDNISVVKGADKPLVGDPIPPTTYIHGRNGLGNVELPKTNRSLTEIPVEDYLYNTAKKYNGELVIITLGSLTNIANTLKKYNDFSKYVKQMVVMGGAIYVAGNVGPNAEANIYFDPEAADMVFLSGIPIRLVGLDVTMKTRFPKHLLEVMKNNAKDDCKNIINYLEKSLSFYINFSRIQDHALDDCPLHDPLAVLALPYPELFTMKYMKARVECSGEFSRGRIVVDTRETNSIKGEKLEICLDVDDKRAVGRLINAFCNNDYEY